MNKFFIKKQGRHWYTYVTHDNQGYLLDVKTTYPQAKSWMIYVGSAGHSLQTLLNHHAIHHKLNVYAKVKP
jgi:hypothetical protein